MTMKNNVGLAVFAIGLVVFIAVITLMFQGSKQPQEEPSEPKKQQQIDPMADHHGNASQTAYTNVNGFIGRSMPAFSVTDVQSNVFTNETLRGKKTVLFFNEGLMCYPACWDQIVSLARDERFKKDDIRVISVVTDPKQEWQKAIEAMPALGEATVVYDEGAALSNALGVTNLPSSMHRGQLPGHTYFVVDPDGVVKFAFDDPSMALNNDIIAQEVNKL